MIALPMTNDYQLNRDTFSMDPQSYIARYAERFSDDEDYANYEQRKRTTPAPTTARAIAGRILSAFANAMQFAVRYGSQVESLESGRGVDGNGGTMAEFVLALAQELVIQSRVGVGISRAIPLTADGRPNPLKPHLILVRAENITDFEYADAGSKSVLSKVEYSDCDQAYKIWLDKSGKVLYQTGENEPIDLNVPAIPFVVIDGGRSSVIANIAQHQRTLTQLLSVAGAESPGLLQSFLARQRDNFNNGSHTRGIDDAAEIGRNRGLFYGKGESAPAFVGQPSAPAAEARAWVSFIISQMESLAGISGDTDPERARALAATASVLGATLAAAERQIWTLLGMYTAEHTRVIKYPLSWDRQTETERQSYIESLYANAQRASGRAGMEAATVLAVEQQFAGQPSATIQAAVNAVRNAPCLINDDTSIIRAFEAGAIDSVTVADSLGCKNDVASKAKVERIEKMQQQAQAAKFASDLKQADRTVGGVGSDRDGELAQKQISQVEQGGDVRGTNR